MEHLTILTENKLKQLLDLYSIIGSMGAINGLKSQLITKFCKMIKDKNTLRREGALKLA
jgi:hypothetical protein